MHILQHLFCWNSSNPVPPSFLFSLARLPSTWRSLRCFLGEVFSRAISLTGRAKAALTLGEGGEMLVPGKHTDTEAFQHLMSGAGGVCPSCASWPTQAECMSIFSKLPIKCLMSLTASRALEALTQTRCYTASLYQSIKLHYWETSTCRLTLLQA